MKTAIIIPAYNAGKQLKNVIQSMPKNINKNDVIVVDDGSKDDTYEIAKSLGVVVLKHEKNMGYGAAQKTAYNYTIKKNYGIVIMIHADGQHDPKNIVDFTDLIENKGFDVVTGTRFKGGSALKDGMPLKKVIGNRLLTSIVRLFTGLKVSETHNGYRAYSIKALKSMDFVGNSNKFEFDTEILLQAKSNKFKIGEIPIKTVYKDEKSHLNIYSYGTRILKVVFRYVFLRKYR